MLLAFLVTVPFLTLTIIWIGYLTWDLAYTVKRKPRLYQRGTKIYDRPITMQSLNHGVNRRIY